MLILKNGSYIDPVANRIERRNLIIQDGRLLNAEEASGIIPSETDEIIDINGLYAAPGLTDMHVHLREPGFEYKEDIISGTQAAAAGGITTLCCMANTNPVIDSPELVRYVLERAREADATVLPVASVTTGQRGSELTDFRALKESGAVALSDDGVPVMDADLMLRALRAAEDTDILIICHSEDASMTDGRSVNEGKISRKLGVAGRPPVAEEYMIARDAMLAAYTGARVHIAHVSTAGSVGIIRAAKKKGIRISCETCPQYFTFTEDEVLRHGAIAKMFPPLRTETDRLAIIEGLADGTIDVIATDHAPHNADEKALGLVAAPGGMIGLETSLAASLTALYHTAKLSLPELIQKMSLEPLRLLKAEHANSAGLVIFDPDEEWEVRGFRSKSSNTPFTGMSLRGKVRYTVHRGKVVFSGER